MAFVFFVCSYFPEKQAPLQQSLPTYYTHYIIAMQVAEWRKYPSRGVQPQRFLKISNKTTNNSAWHVTHVEKLMTPSILQTYNRHLCAYIRSKALLSIATRPIYQPSARCLVGKLGRGRQVFKLWMFKRKKPMLYQAQQRCSLLTKPALSQKKRRDQKRCHC